MVLCGVVWCGLAWCGVVWCGVVWCGVVLCGVVWCCFPKTWRKKPRVGRLTLCVNETKEDEFLEKVLKTSMWPISIRKLKKKLRQCWSSYTNVKQEFDIVV